MTQKVNAEVKEMGPFIFGGCPQWGTTNDICPSFSWNRLVKEKEMIGIVNQNAEYGVCVLPSNYKAGESFYYMASILFDSIAKVPDNLFIKLVPSQSFVVLTAEDNKTESLIALWGQLDEWFKTSEYERANAFTNVEMYTRTSGQTNQIWVPVVKKQK